MVLVAVFMHHNLFLVTLILFDKCRKITEICQIKCEKVRKIPEFSSPHNPEVVGSSPASATIKNTGFRKKSGVFLTFWHKMKLPQNLSGDIQGTKHKIGDLGMENDELTGE